MKRILLILIIALLPLGVQATSRTHAKQNVASMADEAYKAADYATAIEHYESVLADGLASADLYYNLGNAYYRTGQMGRAILNYERALRLDPGMSDARENLALAENHTVDRIAVLPSRPARKRWRRRTKWFLAAETLIFPKCQSTTAWGIRSRSIALLL